MSGMTRAEHLEWCKKRALEYVDVGDLKHALMSFASDIRKHDETKSIGHTVALLGLPLFMAGHLDTPEKMRDHINGYN
jgi:hypothetical protein